MRQYDLPDDIVVEEDGPVRVVRLNRPEQLNAANHVLHAGRAAVWPQVDADIAARAVVLTGNGRAFSAGGDLHYIDEMIGNPDLRKESLTTGARPSTGRR